MSPTGGFLEQQPQDDFLKLHRHHLNKVAAWQEGAGRREVISYKILRGRVLNHGYPSWGL